MAQLNRQQIESELDSAIADAKRWRMLLLTIDERKIGWLSTQVIVNLDVERPGPKPLALRLTEAVDKVIKEAA